MKIKPFAVEEWMNAHETGARYNIAETCVDSVSMDELFALTGENREDFWRAFFRMIFATVITGCVAYSMTKFFPLMEDDNSFFHIFPKFCLIALTSFVAYLLASYFLELDEVKPIFAKLNKIIFRNVITEK